MLCCAWLVTMALHVHCGLGQLSPSPTSGDDEWVAAKHCGRAKRSWISDTHRLRWRLQFRYINNQSLLLLYSTRHAWKNSRLVFVLQFHQPLKPWTMSNLVPILTGVTRTLCWALAYEFLLHYLYCWALIHRTDLLESLPLWSFAAIGYMTFAPSVCKPSSFMSSFTHSSLKSSCPCPHISLQPPLHFYRPTPNNPHTYIRSRCSNHLNLPRITTRSLVQYSFLRRNLFYPHGAHPCRCHKLINPSRMGWFNVAPFQADINSVTHIYMPYHKSLPIIIWFISIANSIFKSILY